MAAHGYGRCPYFYAVLLANLSTCCSYVKDGAVAEPNAIRAQVRRHLLDTFFGPAKTGVYSKYALLSRLWCGKPPVTISCAPCDAGLCKRRFSRWGARCAACT